MSSRASRLRTFALLSLGALLVHELRYRFGYASPHGSDFGGGHGYFEYLVPLIIGLCGLACAQLVHTLSRPDGRAHSRRLRFTSTWLLATATLLAIFAGQELIELAASGAHVSLGGLLASGGWIAGPAALAVAFAIALLLVGADAAVRAALARRTRRAPRAPRARLGCLPTDLAPLSISAAVQGARAPPLFSL